LGKYADFIVALRTSSNEPEIQNKTARKFVKEKKKKKR
jgi:hypothetical protein